ncbi:MAG: hypothetical protein HZC26_02485 [Candidatus Magasanikbacteria bacterium]|nr:hypothetical protein [Candidatus Magasanikbacteria bacterium]
MISRNYNLTWFWILAVLFLTGCAMWSLPMGQTTPQFDLTAMILTIIGGCSITTWFLSEPWAVLEAIALPVLARLERRRITRSPFWRRGRCSPEELSAHITPLLCYCGVGWVQRFDITVCAISLPNVPSSG